MSREASRDTFIALWAVIAGYYAPQSIAEQTTTNSVGQLEEVVVTATKRDSTVQDTPISVTAISGRDMFDRGLTDFTSLAQSVPGISLRTSGPGQTELEMRGLTSAGGNSPTVGFYFEDTPLTAPAEAQNGKVVIDPNLYDLNRIEVLRGPQGTLYGSGSMGGTIKIIPNAPDPTQVAASAQTILGDTRGGGFNHGENAMLNLPLADSVALRIVGSESHDSGWIDRIVIADGQFPPPNGGARGNVIGAPLAATYKDVNDTNLQSVRASLLWKPTDTLSVAPTYFYQRIDQGGLSDIDNNPGVAANFQPFDQAEPFSDNFKLASLKIQYRLPYFDISSTTADWTRDEHLRQDGAEEIADALGLPYYISQGGFGATTPTPLEDDRSKQLTEELRLTSNSTGRFKWLFGWFYGDFRSDWDEFVLQPGALASTGTDDAFTQFQPTKIIQNSFFGEASYGFTSQLTATVGLRRYHYNASINTSVSGFLSAAYLAAAPDNGITSSSLERDQGVTPKFDLSYHVSSDLMVYGTLAKGFRPGGGNQPIPTTGSLGSQCEAQLQANHGTTAYVAAPVHFAPDDVWSYELGEKFRNGDGRLTTNSAVYFEKWNGVQQNIPLACGYPYTDNAGHAQIYGAELELNAVVLQGLIFSANGGYTHAVFVGNNLETGVVSGTAVQDVPQWTASVSLAYRRAIGDALAFVARVENNYVAGHYDATAQVNRLPSYDLTNLRMGLEGNRWTATLFAKNLFNERALLSDVPAINVSVSQFNRVAVSQPLTCGIDLSYRF